MSQAVADRDGGEVVARVLVIDDDAGLCARIGSFLAQYSIRVEAAPDGRSGLALLAAGPVDAVLLDLVMPGMDGLEVIRQIRQTSDVAVLMLTGKDSETERVLALELGADDFIAKPFRPRELLARVRAVLRRAHRSEHGQRLSAGGIEVDTVARTARRGEEVLDLSAAELDILAALMRARGTVLSREALLAESGRSQVAITARTVDVHISRLRKKLDDDGASPRLIKTVHGVGYVFAC